MVEEENKEELDPEEEERRKYAYEFPERQKAKEKKEATAKIEKQAAQKQYYTVELDAWTRTTFKYKVLAEDPVQAVQLIDRAPLLEAPKPKMVGLKKISAKVYVLGSNMLKHMRNF